MGAPTFTVIFLALLVSSVVVQAWLARRQIRYVGARRAAVPADFAGQVSGEGHAKAADYTCTNERFGLVKLAFGTLVLLGWTLLGGLDALNAWILPHTLEPLGPLGYQVALVFAFSLIGGVLDLPFDWYNNFRIEERFGFNRMSIGLWLSDLVKNLIVSTLIGLPLIAVVLWLMGVAGSLWWLWAWIFWMGFNLLLLVLYPMFIAPLFNKFEPLQDEDLKQRVGNLMQRCGFSAKGLFVMDGSKRSAQSNAYFTGIGRSKRVVFYDTLLSRLTHGELEAVLAHELGHFHHKHIVKLIAQMFIASLLALAALGWLAQQDAFFVGLGVQPNATAPNDALALLLFALSAPLAGFFLAPLLSLASRRHEFEADAYACDKASGADLRSALLKLTEDNASTLTPEPLYVRFYYSHPPMTERLAALRLTPLH
jgi:STE24 endopeptidase